ncbi:hypothetical protein Patl1_30625 [Pistacia atlantica]|uniref:Uncharacterized protein n=1 Tax=Pistacia atlantica TaxID=434234 RepID=A0ACC1ADH2_9ROSI|nr:hypothetical protein Patl1_30625 [Pistacia atlantica]
MISITDILMFILRPLHRPRFVAEVIAAGIILAPTLIQTTNVSDKIFTFEDNYVVDNFANLGLTYYMFLVGLEMDVSALRHIGKKSLSISVVGILVPLVAVGGLYFVPIRGVAGGVGESFPMGAMFWAISLSNSSFPDLARILSNVKLLHTDLGRLALTSAFVSAWIFVVITINFYDLHRFYTAAIPTTIFLLACWFLLRPDACGAHSMIGGFMLGLIIPHGDTAVDIMEKIQGFVNQVMLPTTLLICLFHGVPSREALALGGLLNTKGVLSLIVLNEGRSMKEIPLMCLRRAPGAAYWAESDQIINAFENFERANEAAVTMHPLTVVSPYSTMHEDIFQIAEDRHVAFILVPYHKLPTADGRLRNDNVSIRQLNQNLLNSAPCSIGILVDRGVGPSIQGVTLTVVRFLQAKEENTENDQSSEDITKSTDKVSEIDDDFINELRFKTMCEEHIS